MLRKVVFVVDFAWLDHEEDHHEQSVKAFSDGAQARAHLERCHRRFRPDGWPWSDVSGGIREAVVTFVGPCPESLWVVRASMSVGLEGVFVSRAEADAFHADRERAAAEAGDPRLLFNVDELDGMVRYSDFDLSVFGDWLTDHGIMTLPDPAQRRWGWIRWLMSLPREQVTALYAALHRFRFYEVVEVPLIVGDYRQEQWDEWEHRVTDEGAFGVGGSPNAPGDIPF